jgi:hypothetical protein
MLQSTPVIANRPRRRPGSEQRRYDGRSPLAVRIRILIQHYTAAVGIAARDPVMASAIKRAAELQALSEEARAKAVRNGTFDAIALARIQNTADRAVRRLGLDHHEPPPSLDELLRR